MAVGLLTTTMTLDAALSQCQLLIDQRQYEQAEILVRQILNQQPNNPAVRFMLVTLRSAQRRHGEALELQLQTITNNPNQSGLYCHLGYIYRDLKNFDAALTAFTTAIELNPDLPINYYNVADIHQHQGALKKAEAMFRQSINHHPEYSLSYTALANLIKLSADDPLVNQIYQQLNNDALGPASKSHLHFALGKIFDDNANPAQAFDHWSQANRLADKHFDWRANRNWVNSIMQRYPVGQPPAPTTKLAAEPVFVVGMPRSGTSLTEQILASHPEVFGAGETAYLLDLDNQAAAACNSQAPFPAYIGQLANRQLEQLAADYLDNLNSVNVDHQPARRIVDKYPLNFVYIGLILQLFPHAKIIHVRRHPLDTCLSCHSKNFTNTALTFTASLPSMGQVYQDYQRLMAHWHLLYPGKILDLDYDQLVTDQERQSRRLIEFVGLDWHEQCLQFHRTRRSVQSASFTQVREPIYQSSVGRWQAYARQLKPIADILNIDISVEISRQA